MTKVRCYTSDCEFWTPGDVRSGFCGRDEIELDDTCGDYVNHTDISPEHRKTFWKRVRSRKDKHECKLSCEGKRFEICGLVWFTDQDDRWGIDELSFTEERSGLRCKGRDINEANIEKIKKILSTVSPVEDLPEATQEDGL